LPDWVEKLRYCKPEDQQEGLRKGSAGWIYEASIVKEKLLLMSMLEINAGV